MGDECMGNAEGEHAVRVGIARRRSHTSDTTFV
jgi:hypothetical protein